MTLDRPEDRGLAGASSSGHEVEGARPAVHLPPDQFPVNGAKTRPQDVAQIPVVGSHGEVVSPRLLTQVITSKKVIVSASPKHLLARNNETPRQLEAQPSVTSPQATQPPQSPTVSVEAREAAEQLSSPPETADLLPLPPVLQTPSESLLGPRTPRWTHRPQGAAAKRPPAPRLRISTVAERRGVMTGRLAPGRRKPVCNTTLTWRPDPYHLWPRGKLPEFVPLRRTVVKYGDTLAGMAEKFR